MYKRTGTIINLKQNRYDKSTFACKGRERSSGRDKKAAEQENKTVSRYVNDTLKNHLRVLSEKCLGEVSGETEEEEGTRG